MITGLVKLGILKGDVDTLITENAHRPYFMRPEPLAGAGCA